MVTEGQRGLPPLARRVSNGGRGLFSFLLFPFLRKLAEEEDDKGLLFFYRRVKSANSTFFSFFPRQAKSDQSEDITLFSFPRESGSAYRRWSPSISSLHRASNSSAPFFSLRSGPYCNDARLFFFPPSLGRQRSPTRPFFSNRRRIADAFPFSLFFFPLFSIRSCESG